MNNLRDFRKLEGLTQEQMAKKLGFTVSMYEKVEGGRAGASAAFMRKFKLVFPHADIESIFFDSKQQ